MKCSNSKVVKEPEYKPSILNKLIPYPLIFPILMPILFPLTLVGIIATCFTPEESAVRHIRVNGQDCTIKYVVDHRNSHGGIIGHDEAVCP